MKRKERDWKVRFIEILAPICEKYMNQVGGTKEASSVLDKQEAHTYRKIPEDQRKAWADECEVALLAEGFVIDRIDRKRSPPLDLGGDFKQRTVLQEQLERAIDLLESLKHGDTGVWLEVNELIEEVREG